MSSDRSGNASRLLKPTVAPRVPRAPLTPRVAGSGAASTTRLPAPRAPSVAQSEPPRARVKQQDTPVTPALGNGNITPRSSARKSRVDGSDTPTLDDTPTAARPRSTNGASASVASERTGGVGGLGIGSQQHKVRTSRPQSVVSESSSSRATSPALKSPNMFDQRKSSAEGSIDSRFFHASDAQKHEPAPKKTTAKKTPTFFYANEQQDQRHTESPRATSPVLSAVSEKRTSGPWIRADGASNPSRSPPLLSPALSALSSTSPFFAPSVSQPRTRSSSPSKENIHLSYRKGASQIFGTRPAPRSMDGSVDSQTTPVERRPSLSRSSIITTHRKSPSLSSIDSSNSPQSRRRSATNADGFATTSPLVQEVRSVTIPRVSKPVGALPSIETSLDPSSTDDHPVPESVLSPTRNVSDLAADARRERKVLDLEISNSSLLAINSSLEREVRRQKAELKRFRRLSRAGRFSMPQSERSVHFSEGLSTLGEDDLMDEEYSTFGPPSGFTDVYDDFSEEESESVTSGGEPLSPTAQSDRLANDEKRLRVDLERHKELLVQSQMMNQSLKRCMYTTEEMIKDGKKALLYHVRVSDVKLGGRILTGHEGDEGEEEQEGEQIPEIQVEDELTLHADDAAKGFLDVWQGLGTLSFEGNSESGDRDSGIEVDKPPFARALTAPGAVMESMISKSGRPPDETPNLTLVVPEV